MTAFKRTQARYARRSYKTTNWPEYEAGLRKRGSLTVWISEDELKGWEPPKHGQRKPGGQQQYSNHAIETALTVAMVFHLGLRHTRSGYSRRSMVENTMYRHKAIIGPTMRSRTLREGWLQDPEHDGRSWDARKPQGGLNLDPSIGEP